MGSGLSVAFLDLTIGNLPSPPLQRMDQEVYTSTHDAEESWTVNYIGCVLGSLATHFMKKFLTSIHIANGEFQSPPAIQIFSVTLYKVCVVCYTQYKIFQVKREKSSHSATARKVSSNSQKLDATVKKLEVGGILKHQCYADYKKIN